MSKINSFGGDYAFLSNFHPTPIEVTIVTHDGDEVTVTSPTVEHAYQAYKATNRNDALWVNGQTGPKDTKRAGRKIQVRPDWEEIKLDVMEMLLRKKFSIEKYAERLRNTGDAQLEEGNWWGDKFWGVHKGIGENHLGRLLMKIRSEL